MDLLEICATVSGVGALGGLINCAIADEFKVPRLDANLKIWRPGWLGNVLVGAVAALVVWAMYGPLANYDLAQDNLAIPLSLKLSQLFTSVIIGIGGGNILTQMAQRQADRITKDNLLAAIATASRPQQPPAP